MDLESIKIDELTIAEFVSLVKSISGNKSLSVDQALQTFKAAQAQADAGLITQDQLQKAVTETLAQASTQNVGGTGQQRQEQGTTTSGQTTFEEYKSEDQGGDENREALLFSELALQQYNKKLTQALELTEQSADKYYTTVGKAHEKFFDKGLHEIQLSAARTAAFQEKVLNNNLVVAQNWQNIFSAVLAAKVIDNNELRNQIKKSGGQSSE